MFLFERSCFGRPNIGTMIFGVLEKLACPVLRPQGR